MGRGNVCVHGPYEGLYYIDNDYLHIYRQANDQDGEAETRTAGELSYEEITGKDWVYDSFYSDQEWEDTKRYLVERMTERFKSFSPCDKWIGRTDQHAIMESSLFYVAVEDNQWSMAVKLLQKEDAWNWSIASLQKRHYQTYLNCIRDILFEMFDTLGTYSGAWTSGTIRREEVQAG